jgi:hypothetical protein
MILYKKLLFIEYTMKLTQEQFKQFILAEVKKIALEEGWIATDSLVVSEGVKSNEEAPIVTEEVTTEQEIVEEPKIEIAEVKRLAEEFSRMKELVDFRRPLLSNDK